MSLSIHADIYRKVEYFLTSQKIPNIIFHGPHGGGKRTLVNDFVEKIYDNDKEMTKAYVMNVNCAHGKGIKFVREELKFFAKTHINLKGRGHFKTIILSNADKLTIDAQSALRRCIELFSHTTRFFIIVENRYKSYIFVDCDPTAEMLAKKVYDYLSEMIATQKRVQIDKVSV